VAAARHCFVAFYSPEPIPEHVERALLSQVAGLELSEPGVNLAKNLTRGADQ
jgi:hypothetical protein